MKTRILLVSLLLVCGCVQEEGVVCDRPYILVGGECCLDKNDNGVCDSDETTITTSTTTSMVTTSSTTSTTAGITTTASSTTSTTSTVIFSYDDTEIKSSWAERAPKIDGKMYEDEWTDASILILSDVERLYIKNNHERLFFLYEKEGGRESGESAALYFDPDGDGRYNYAMSEKIFLKFKLLGDFIGCRSSAYCGNPSYSASFTDCGVDEYVKSGCKVRSMESSAGFISEASIPIGADSGKKSFVRAGDTAYFWFGYEYHSPRCYPETTKCFDEPAFSQLRLSDMSGS